MEVGSYKRSYEFIVRLHMLKELEEGVQMLLGMGGEGQKQTKEELLSHWRRRLEATQVRKRLGRVHSCVACGILQCTVLAGSFGEG